MDAAALVIPLAGFLPAADPRVRSALLIAKAEVHGPEERAKTSAERAGQVEETRAVSDEPRRRGGES